VLSDEPIVIPFFKGIDMPPDAPNNFIGGQRPGVQYLTAKSTITARKTKLFLYLEPSSERTRAFPGSPTRDKAFDWNLFVEVGPFDAFSVGH